MNPNNTIEYNSLSWVKAQLDDVLADAQSNLNEYIENKTDEHLENCIEHLQLIYGTLQMVEVYGASMLAEEMKLTTTALLEGKVESAYDAYDVLMRAMLLLPDYLEGVQAGKTDAPITLMPLINDLRVVRKESLLTEGTLFSPDIENAVVVSESYEADSIEIGGLQNEVKRLRTHYQLGLLDYIQNNKERIGLQRIKAVLNSLEKVSANAEVRNIWMVVGALVDGLINKGIEKNLSINKLLSNIDRQLKIILDVGEDEFLNQYSKELVKNALYYVGSCTVDSDVISAVKETYRLNDLMPQEADEAVGGLNADLFDTVSKGIAEDLAQVKDVLELFMHSNEQDLERLVPVAEQLGRIGDTYGMLGMGGTRQSIMDQRVTLEKIIEGTEEASEKVVLEIASGLLSAEAELKDYIAERSGFVDMNPEKDVKAVPASEYRNVIFTVVAEAMKNFGDAKEAVLSYVAGIGDKEQLDIVIDRLEEVRGVAMMLPLRRVGSQIERLQKYIRVVLLNNKHEVTADEQDTVADVVTSIEYFFEALSEGRPGVEQGLNSGDEAASKLEVITQGYLEELDDLHIDDIPLVDDDLVEDQPVDEVKDNIIAFDGVEETSLDVAGISDESAISEPVVDGPETNVVDLDLDSEPQDTEQDTEQYTILADDADEEIVEIFIEEAVEVLGELHEYLPQWQADSENEEALAVVRRGFHTLKGSGRLLGAEMIGEFSWKFEDMLNSFIENKIIVSDAMNQALDEALTVLPQLIEQLKGNREPIENIGQLMSSAEAISEGRNITFEPVVETEKGSDAEVNESEASAELQSDSEAVIEPEAEIEDVDIIGNDEVVLKLDDVSDDLAIDDDSDIDISELDADNNFSLDEAYINTDALDDERLATIISEDVKIEEIIDGETEEVVSLAATDVIEDDFDVETEDLEESDISLRASSEDNEAVETVAVEDKEVITLSDDLAEDDFDIEIEDLEESDLSLSESSENNVAVSNEEVITLSEDSDDVEIIIAEDAGDFDLADDELDIDPMLLTIYHDESIGHLDDVKAKLDEYGSSEGLLQADKILLRAFHTLYGSARTAEVESIADLAGATEKYIKARQDGGDENIPDDTALVIREVEQSVSAMLGQVVDGKLPASNDGLHEKINRIVQQEIQSQLQKSWQDHTASTEEVVEGALEEESLIDVDDTEVHEDDDLDVIRIVDIEDEGHDVSEEADKGEEESIEVSYGDIDDELIDIFLEEADELLENCERTLSEIKNQPNSTEHIHQLQRNMHTLKGGARMADLAPVGDLTHNLESLVVMVSDSKVKVDKALFDLLQESLDALIVMLASVKKRQPITAVDSLNDRVEMLMRGEVHEKRSVERFDVDLDELESDDYEELEDIDISDFLPKSQDEADVSQPEPQDEADTVVRDITDKIDVVDAAVKSEPEDSQKGDDEARTRAHWGERATDVNYKETQEQVRVRADLLNNLVNYAGEVNIYHARMGKQVTDVGFNLAELTQTVVRLKEQLRNLEIETEIQIRSGYEKEADNFDDGFDPLEMDQYSTLQQLTRSLSETAGDVESINEILTEIVRDSETLLVQESRVSSDLQEGLMRTRMVRFGGLSSRLRRIARQVARELGKEVEVEIDGENSEVDRTVLDRIIAPLEHMLRNAVVHGIENPDARRVLGKKETGKIVITVDRQGSDVVINVKDDGAGIDADKIRQKAISQGLLTEGSKLTDRDVLQFILHSGFSTADEVTQVAGRGVGMDVVDSEIKQLGGVLEIDTVQGKGTEFNIRLPLTLAINQALLVSAADDVYAVPLSSIEGVVRITGLELQRFYDSENSHYEFNGVEYELKHLGGLLTGQQSNYSKQLQLFPVLLVHVGDQHFALHVEDLLGRREIVVKPVGMQIGSVHGIAGATILADGRVVLILEMSALVVAESLFKSTAINEVIENPAVDVVKTVMVVDDSITIRKITERMLKRYGIEVVLAKDGVDATNLLQENVPDLMLLDIEMPRMDGFEVASYVRNDDRLKDIPIIMITSRTGSKHKEKAMEIGVDQYLGKPFQEDDLISNINEILNTSF